MAWRITSEVEITDALENRVNDLMLALVIGRSRPQWTGPRTEDVKWRIIDATFHELLPWEGFDHD